MTRFQGSGDVREAMVKGRSAPVMDYFRGLENPRIERNKRHRLPDIVAIAICVVICGADS